MPDTKTSAETAITILKGAAIIRGVQDAANGKMTVEQVRTVIHPDGVGDMSTDDTAAVAAALSAASPSKAVRLAKRHAVTAFDNSLGAPFEGAGFARLTSGALRGIPALRSPRLGFGQELLHVFHTRLYSGLVHTIAMTGDSTTSLFDSTLLPKYAAHFNHKTCTFDNRGHSGATAADWVTTYLAGDIAASKHLLIVRWGANDPTAGRTVAQAIASIRTGLATIRGTAGQDLKGLSILLCSPTVMSDPTLGREESYFEGMSNGLRQAAIDYDCAFLDLYALFTNARGGSYATGNAAANLWMDDPFANGTAIHPSAMHNFRINQAIAEFIYGPLEMAPYYAGELYRASSATTAERTAVATDNPTTYPYGVSTYRTDGTFPYNAFVTTFRHYDGYPFQINSGASGEIAFQFRTATSGTAWTAWSKVSGVTGTAATVGSGFSLPGGGENMTSFWDGISNGTVIADGYLSQGSAAIIAGQTIATLAHAPASGKTYCQLGFYNGSWEYGLGEVLASGVVKAVNNSVASNITRVYITATYRKA